MDTIMPGLCPESIAVGLMLGALNAKDSYDQVTVAGLPPYSIYVPDRQLIVAATAAPAPLFSRDLELIAGEQRLDVVLLRIADAEHGGPIAVDFALGALPCAVWAERGFELYRDMSGTWLVPGGSGPAVRVNDEGCNLELVPPYETSAERECGIERIADDFFRFLQPMEVC